MLGTAKVLALASRLIAVLAGAAVGLVAVIFGGAGAAGADPGSSGSKSPTTAASSASSGSNPPAGSGASSSTGSSTGSTQSASNNVSASPGTGAAAPGKPIRTGAASTGSAASSGPAGSQTTRPAAGLTGAAAGPEQLTAPTSTTSPTKSRPNHKGALNDAPSSPALPTVATDASGSLTSSTAARPSATAQSDPVGAIRGATIPVAVAAVTPSATTTAAASQVSATSTQDQQPTASTTAPPENLGTIIATAIESLLAPLSSPLAGQAPATPADSPATWMMLAAARRETFGAAATLSTAASTVTNSLTTAAVNSSPITAAPTAQTGSSSTLTGSFQQVVYNPLHTIVEDWIDSALGQQIDGLINTLAGSYVIGNGAAGTAANPTGGAAGWLLGDGGAGWDSTEAGVAGGAGGAAGILGNGGAAGTGGAGANGGAGGAGGLFMGIGGAGGAGGSGAAGGAGGAGGTGGAATALLFGVGGGGGVGGDGSDGGRGGDGGNGADLLGSGGDGGGGGKSGVGGNSTGLPALGGAGGDAGSLGSHGAVGNYGTGAALQNSNGSLMPISTTGTWLTNSDGQVVLMHGLNEVYKLAPFEPSASGFSNDDAAFLAANGFNVVRLGVIWAGVEPAPGVFDTAYIDSIQQTVQTLANHGIYTILDFHQDEYSAMFGGEGAPAWASQSGGLPNTSFPFPYNEFLDPAETHAWDAFWSNAGAPNGLGLEDDYAQMLETVGGDFNGNTDVLGFEIMNEPYPGSQAVPTLLGSPFFDTQELNPFYDQAASAIRAVDPSTTIFYEPNLISAFGVSPTKLGTLDTTNTVFSYHNYLTNYIPFGFVADIVVGESQAYAAANGIPSFMTEFGATNSQSSLTASMQAADQALTSWTEWTYSGQGDITTTGNPDTESLVDNPALPPTGANVNTGNLMTLAEPYPQAISGTPNSFSFNNGTFEFIYSTEKADGSGSFPAGAQTDISVPTVEFPNGYQVSVTGGQVVSAPNAPVLVIASNNGASNVDVVVSAG